MYPLYTDCVSIWVLKSIKILAHCLSNLGIRKFRTIMAKSSRQYSIQTQDFIFGLLTKVYSKISVMHVPICYAATAGL